MEDDGTVLNFVPHIFKYWDQEAEPGASSSGNDFFNMRYSDILLMYAEALAEENGGPTAEAYDAINQVRRRARFDGDTGMERPGVLPDLNGLSLQQFRDSVWLERRRELVWEGQRWFELVRTNRLVEKVKVVKPTSNVQDFHVLFPIPQRERNINPNLTQNPGY